MDQRDRIMKARTALILDDERGAFFGTLAMRLAIVESPCGTGWTDGTRLGYDPEWLARLSDDELLGFAVHEVMHCAAGHIWRIGNRDKILWNVACDYVINHMLKEAGFTLPEGALYDPKWAGKSAEWVYDRIPKQPGKGKGKGKGKGGSTGTGIGTGGDPSGKFGEVRSPEDGPENERDSDGIKPMTEAGWKEAVSGAANTAKLRGKLPAGFERFADAVLQSVVDWRSVLLRFAQQAAKTDYTWKMPNRRYVASGLYLPSLYSEVVGPVAVGIDVSGSIDQTLLNQWAGELQSILDTVKPENITVYYCDARVSGVEVFEPGDVVKLKATGGGGTDFRPVFHRIEKDGLMPICLVYLTDLHGTFPRHAPEYPVLWATVTARESTPFGEVVLVK